MDSINDTMKNKLATKRKETSYFLLTILLSNKSYNVGKSLYLSITPHVGDHLGRTLLWDGMTFFNQHLLLLNYQYVLFLQNSIIQSNK